VRVDRDVLLVVDVVEPVGVHGPVLDVDLDLHRREVVLVGVDPDPAALERTVAEQRLHGRAA
jgi:hypothetical protein